MSELTLEEKPGFFTKLADVFSRKEIYEDIPEEMELPTTQKPVRVQPSPRYQITVRRQILSFQDAIAAADGLKRGEQQILNLAHTDSILRDKIKDFMCGVNYAQEGSWEEIGDCIYLLAPSQALVEVASTNPRVSPLRN